MNIQYQFSDLIILAGLILSIMMAIAFGIKAKRHIASVWLVGFFISSAVVLIVKFLYNTGDIIQHPHWFKVNYPAGILRPVFIYLYVYFMLKELRRFKLKYLLHLIPFALLIFYLFPFFIKNSEYKLAVLNNQLINTLGLIPSWYILFQFIYSIIYLVFTYSVLRNYTILHPRPNRSEQIIVRWIRFLVFGGLLYLSIAIVLRLLDLTGDYNYYLYEIFSIFLVLLCIKLLTLPTSINVILTSKDKYQNSTLTENDIDLYFSQIKQLMQKENIYRKENLKLKDLADELALPEYLVSQIINARSKQSFRDYLNGYRIAEAKNMLLTSHPIYSIEGIAYDVGFHSRASFYNAFKKFTNLTPSQYVKLMN